jgi:hypothetical protein
MSKTVIRVVEDLTGRRAFLKKASMVGGALLAGIFGATHKAEACSVCCTLIKNPSTCTWGPCGCVWAWMCPYQPDCIWYWCEECFPPPQLICDGSSFANVTCSRFRPSPRRISQCQPM